MIQDDSALDIRIKNVLCELSLDEVKRLNHLAKDILYLHALGIIFLDDDRLALLRAMKPRLRRYHEAIMKGRY